MDVIKFLQNIIVIILFPVYSVSIAQHTNIKVADHLNSGEPEEPSIIINPVNPDNILVGSNSDNYYYSTDRGETWVHGVLTSTYGVSGDPVVLVDNKSNFYYFHLVSNLNKVVCQKTTTIGGRWSDGTYTGVNGIKDNDKEWAAVDLNNNYLYVSWSQFDTHGSSNPQHKSEILLSRSTDDGLTWSTPVAVSDKKGDATGGNTSTHASMPAIGQNGDVYVTWMSPDGLMFDKSDDYGETWLPNDINISNKRINWLYNVPGLIRCPSFPVISCDLSQGPNNGNIYITWADQSNGFNDTDVWMVKSLDAGITWSDAVRVNDDSAGKHQFFPTLTIDQSNGNLYFLFYDRRNHNGTSTDVFMALSKDGGESFTNFKISENLFIATTNAFLGDYIGISATNNVIRPVWTRIDNNELSLWTALIEPASITVVDELKNKYLPEEFILYPNYPNPFNPSTQIKFGLPSTAHVKLIIFNSLGQEVRELVNKEMKPGTYQIEFNAVDLPSGVYLYTINVNNNRKSRKMLYLK